MSDNQAVSWSEFETRFGKGYVIVRAGKIVRVILPGKERRDTAKALLAEGCGPEAAKAGSPAARFARHLAESFDGKADPSELLKHVEWPALAAFSDRIQHLCAEIPVGKVRSYGDLAVEAKSPLASRAVGNVMRNNKVPLIIPCHRVVSSDHPRTVHYGGGAAMKEWLQDKEREFAARAR